MHFQLILNDFLITEAIFKDSQEKLEPYFEIEIQKEIPYTKKQILHFSSANQNIINLFKKNNIVYNWIFSFDDFLDFIKKNDSQDDYGYGFNINENTIVVSPQSISDSINEKSYYLIEIENYFKKILSDQDIQFFKYLENIENSYDKELRKFLRIKLNLVKYIRNKYSNLF
jgi:hypothetical protein